jgi:hypothetical protein
LTLWIHVRLRLAGWRVCSDSITHTHGKSRRLLCGRLEATDG